MDEIVNAINSLTDFVSNFFEQVLSFLSSCLDVVLYIWSILQTMWYWLVTLLSSTYDLIVELFTSWLF